MPLPCNEVYLKNTKNILQSFHILILDAIAGQRTVEWVCVDILGPHLVNTEAITDACGPTLRYYEG